MKVWALLLILGLIGSARAFAMISPVPENIFTPDGRLPVHAFEGPARWTGKLVLPNGDGCTATLVYSDVILTAAHCVLNSVTNSLLEGTFVFQLGLIRGQAVVETEVTRIWPGTRLPGKFRGSDWALLRLKDAIGEAYGWMSIHPTPLKDLIGKDVLGITGYSSGYREGQTAAIQAGCRITAVKANGTVLHDCDTLPGVSGAPLYHRVTDDDGVEHYYMVAINVASPKDARRRPYIDVPYSDKIGNIAVPASRFLSRLRRLIALSPSRERD